ncbi:MAG TPA: ribosome maturation factor RimP [Intrasporangium sp.]|uniref:ribosome maturation factor RimP n=1 Tax=Intrasporangium sp. TaxID=1925024 RepID=UPI002D78F571|nr:ribosome maturation factor RimP [Intrasporangium sp.]HET7397131.1 ribosome maturation factor RimP [Intrasporangium sp.]
MTTAQQIRAELDPVLSPLGLIVEDVTISPAGRRRVVRVLVDTDVRGLDPSDTRSQVAPLTLDAVAEATRAVDGALEASGTLGEAPYVLEVSSPGVGRPLTTREHFRRNVGRLVEVRAGDDVTTGRVLEVGPTAVVLAVPATRTSPARTVTLDLVTAQGPLRGTVQVEFARGDAGDDLDDTAAGDALEAEEED